MPELLIDARLTLGSCTLDVALEVHRGPLLLVGPNGAGKSTLLRALAGGNVAVDGRIARRDAVWVDSARGVWCPPEHRSVGYLPQGGCLFPHLSVLANVAFGIHTTRTTEAWRWLERLDLTHLAERRARDLSGGEAQRVALARALARHADLLLLDEPTAALDVLARARTRPVVREAVGTQGTMGVVVTHDVRDLAAWGGQIALVDKQRVTPPKRFEELLAAPTGPFLAELLAPLATP